MALRQIFNPSDPVHVRDMNEMFRELYTTKLPLSGGTLTGDLDIGGHGLKNHAEITADNGNIYETYPLGTSYSVIGGSNQDQSTGEDFPSYGILETYNYSSGRFEQTLTAHSSNKRYYRTYYSGTWQPWTGFLDKNNTNKLLWSGSWSSGNITVPDFEEYSVFRIKISSNAARFLAVADGGCLRGGTIYALSSGAHSIQVSATYSGTTLTWGYCNRFSHMEGAAHNGFYDGGSSTILEIWGVI